MGRGYRFTASGGLGIVVLLERFRKHPFLIFSIAALGCGLMEYLTGWYLETFKHLKWWDYGDAFLSLDGRICFLSVFYFWTLRFVYDLLCFILSLQNFLTTSPLSRNKSSALLLVLSF